MDSEGEGEGASTKRCNVKRDEDDKYIENSNRGTDRKGLNKRPSPVTRRSKKKQRIRDADVDSIETASAEVRTEEPRGIAEQQPRHDEDEDEDPYSATPRPPQPIGEIGSRRSLPYRPSPDQPENRSEGFPIDQHRSTEKFEGEEAQQQAHSNAVIDLTNKDDSPEIKREATATRDPSTAVAPNIAINDGIDDISDLEDEIKAAQLRKQIRETELEEIQLRRRLRAARKKVESMAS